MPELQHNATTSTGSALFPASGTSGGRRSSSRLLQWFGGSARSDYSFGTDEISLEVWTSRWNTKWEEFQRTFPDNTATTSRMTRQEMSDHVRNTEAEITRVWNRWSELQIGEEEIDIQAGSTFVGQLVDEVPPLISWLNQHLARPDGDPTTCTSKVSLSLQTMAYLIQGFSGSATRKSVPILHAESFECDEQKADEHRSEMAKSRCNAFFVLLLPRRADTVEKRNRGLEVDSTIDLERTNHSDISVDTLGFRRPERSSPMPMPSPAAPNEQLNAANTNNSQSGPVVFPAEAQGMVPSIPLPVANINVAQTAPVSSASQHKANLTSLLAMSFFGASISWSTVFSGTRGDLIVISWSASVFIVGTACAASGMILVETDENIMTRFIQVRWAVRALMFVSVLHVFAGLGLISVALILLDPNAQEPKSEISTDGSFARRN
ncbi:hypothetical protein VNI00_010737 [Paramarasmius palmivorus]|uniref:Uncharacterized protein n=1 Tax=Paramarasmius palmivorus TaxID=297713 RepID=A0AAW0CHJ4_9AGAR